MTKLNRETRRLVVRCLKPTDYLTWQAAHSSMIEPRNKWDKKNRSAQELSRSHFRKILHSHKKQRDEDRFFVLGVFHKKSHELLGNVGLMDLQRGISQSAYLGYTIFNRHWGKGYGKESVLAAIDIAFKDLGLHRIEAGIEPTNRRSIFLARSLGLRKEGLKKRAIFVSTRNRWVDLLSYSATCEDFGIKWKGKTQTRPH